MRVNLTIALFFIATIDAAQTPGSAWFASYYKRFIVDTGTYLPATNFIDKNGHKKTLEDFNDIYL